MQLNYVTLKNFRNFEDETIHLPTKALIIGSNDVGKTNLLYAIRLLLDPNLSQRDIEPIESDFCVYSTDDVCEITLAFTGITEEILITKLRGNLSDDGEFYLRYKAQKESLNYELYIGYSLDKLELIETRFYVRYLNVRFIGSRRDLFSFIRGEKKNLLQDAREARNSDEEADDKDLLKDIKIDLQSVDSKVKSLSYIQRSTGALNEELKSLSQHNADHAIVFDTGATDSMQFVDNLQLASKVNDKNIQVGGDGRNSQIHIALWSLRHTSSAIPDEISIFCIEEPEIHLHPHQQRRIATYLANTISSQVIITSHSAQIAELFPPASLIRLYKDDVYTRIAGSEASLENDFINFGYRHNLLIAETFFAESVFLVEGPSEELFYKTLCQELPVKSSDDDFVPDGKYNLDRNNISILAVNGVGFEPYITILKALKIPYAMRTDNDIFKQPKLSTYRLAGISRIISIVKQFVDTPSEEISDLLDDEFKTEITGLSLDDARRERQSLEAKTQYFGKHGIFIANVDLEHDLYNIIGDILDDYFGETDGELTIKAMQQQKATFMYNFLRERINKLPLKDIHDSLLFAPIRYLVG